MGLLKHKENSKIKPEEININISLKDINDEMIRQTLTEYNKNINNYVSFINNLLKNDLKIDTINSSFNIYKEYDEKYFGGYLFAKMFVYSITWNFPLKKYKEIENDNSYLSFRYVTHEDVLTHEEIELETLQIKITMPKFLNMEDVYIFSESGYNYNKKYNLELILNDNNIIKIILEIRKLKEIYELKNKLKDFSLSKLNKI